MEKDLLLYLLAAFPTDSRTTSKESSPDSKDTRDHLVIRGYRVPFESPLDDVMLGVLAEFRRSGFSGDSLAGIDRG
jgi:hypothetical protein